MRTLQPPRIFPREIPEGRDFPMPTPPFPSSPPFLPHHFKLAVVSCVLFFGRATQLPADVRRRYAGGHVLSDLQSCPELGPRGLLRRKVPTLMLRGGHGSGHDDSSAISQQPAEVGNRLFAHITTSRGSMEAESDSTSKAGQVVSFCSLIGRHDSCVSFRSSSLQLLRLLCLPLTRQMSS